MACFAECGPEVKRNAQYFVTFISAAHSFSANEKNWNFWARPERFVNDILSLKTSGSGDENDGAHDNILSSARVAAARLTMLNRLAVNASNYATNRCYSACMN